MKKLLLLIACMALLVGCQTSIRDIIPIPTSFTPSYILVEETDISVNAAQVLRVRIILPESLSESDIINNFRSYVVKNFEETGILNVTIFAYSDQTEIDGSYTVAKYEFCPYGDWGKVYESVSLDKYAENYDINSSYFQPSLTEDKSVKIGNKVALFTNEDWDSDSKSFVPAKTTKFSNSPTDFNDEKIINVKNGTAGTVVDEFSQTMTGGSKWVAFQIKLNNGKIGWVLAENLKIVE